MLHCSRGRRAITFSRASELSPRFSVRTRLSASRLNSCEESAGHQELMETKNPGDKTLSVAPKKSTLSLKRGVERDTVRQSFSHGRTNTVQVERKKRRILLPGETARPEPPAPVRTHEPAAAGNARVHAHEPAPPASPAGARAGLVLRQLSDDEIDARARALADAKLHEAEERKAAEEAASRRAAESARTQREREDAERRKN